MEIGSKMWKKGYLIIGVVFLYCVYTTSATTMCYQCDTWETRNCSDDDYIPEKYLVPCGWRGQITPTTCLKEVTTFNPGQFAAQLDPQNRFGRPHIMRRCGISVIPNYRSEDYDRCTEQEVLVNGIVGTRRICSCSSDGCNSAISGQLISVSTLFTSVITAISYNLWQSRT